jgi:Fe-S cluster biogenesis protein NfuA
VYYRVPTTQVIRVDDASGMALSSVTADIVESILEPIRPAIKAMNGKVEVRSAIDGVVTLAYRYVH